MTQPLWRTGLLLLVCGAGIAGVALLTQRMMPGRTDVPTPPSKIDGPLARGRLVYLSQCLACHGTEGQGDGPTSATLTPPPRDFTGSHWRLGTDLAVLRRVVAQGIPGTGMPGFSAGLSESDREAVIEYVRTLAPPEDAAAKSFAVVTTAARRAGFEPPATPWPPIPFEVRDPADRPLSSVTLLGKPAVLVFWGTACVHCRKEFPTLARLGRELTIVPICTDSDDPAEAARVAEGTGLTVYVDPTNTLAARYDVQALPTVVIVDAEGRVVGRRVGAIDWLTPACEELLIACRLKRSAAP